MFEFQNLFHLFLFYENVDKGIFAFRSYLHFPLQKNMEQYVMLYSTYKFIFCEFQIFALGTLATGLVLRVLFPNGADFVEINFLLRPSLPIYIGLIMLIVVVFGYCGAATKNYYIIFIVKYFILI